MFEKKKIKSPSDGLEISILLCRPELNKNNPVAAKPASDTVIPLKGLVQIVHGMCEHKERYMPLMEYLAGNGYASIIHDHRGHGESIEDKNDLGYFYKGGYIAMIEDIKAVGDLAKAEFPDLPTVLLGHSMGSMAVRAYVKRYDKTIAGLIVCGSPSYNPAAGIGKAVARTFAIFGGPKYRPKLVQKLSFGAFNRNIANPTSPNSWVCSDPDVVQAYDNDPFCNFQFTANGFINLFSLMKDAYSMPRASARNTGLPVMFISGAEDPCLTSQAMFGKAVNKMREAGYSRTEAKLYPGMRHEILNETGKAAVWADVLAFADRCCTR